MKSFLVHILKLLILTLVVLLISLFFIPDKVSQTSILAAITDKHQALKNITKPKIILTGGSNASFGMNSKMLEDTFHKPVYNMGVHAGIGLKFMIDDIKPYIKPGDTIILMPEYEHFYTDNFYGEMELVSVIFDIEPESKQLLSPKQWSLLLKYLPTYSAKKIKNYIPSLFQKGQAISIYHRHSFNQYGDAWLHWNQENQNYLPASKNNGQENINKEAIQYVKDFKGYVNSQKAKLFIFPPVIDSTSFENQKLIITKIAETLKNNDIAFACDPSHYRYSNVLFFNSYYHLNKTGVDKRTQQLIADLTHKNE